MTKTTLTPDEFARATRALRECRLPDDAPIHYLTPAAYALFESRGADMRCFRITAPVRAD